MSDEVEKLPADVASSGLAGATRLAFQQQYTASKAEQDEWKVQQQNEIKRQMRAAALEASLRLTGTGGGTVKGILDDAQQIYDWLCDKPVLQ